MKRPSIRRRLTLGCLSVAAVVLFVSKVFIYRDVSHSLRSKLDRQLVNEANLLSKSSELEADGIVYEWEEALQSSAGMGIGGMFQLWDVKSGNTSRSPDLGNDDLEFFHGELDRPVFRDLILKNGDKVRAVGLLHHPFTNRYGRMEMERRGRILKIEDYPQVVVCARETAGMERDLAVTRFRLIKTGVLTLGAVWLAIFLIIRWTLSPIDRLAGNLAKRSLELGTPLPAIPERLPEELYPLAIAFNETLHRIELSREHEKEFAYSAAHQLRTPISGIHAILELAHRKPEDGADLKRRIGRALAVSGRMKETINSLMRLARLRGGLEEAVAEEYDASLILREVLSDEKDRGENRFSIETKGLDDAVRIKGDKGLFRIVVSNLLENAFRYTPEGGRIRISMSREKESLVLEVGNDCDGLAEEDCERIFRPFERGRNVSVNDPGAGLGLSLSKEISLRCKGTLVASLKDGSVVFRLEIPA
ncbi:MAG: HAMP domain-containing sensor histidine kinase [Luteolibacter sp.]